MRRLLPALLFLLASPLLAAPLTWTDSIRDVYADGVLVRGGQTLVAGKKLAWIPPTGEVLIFDRGTHIVGTTDRGVFSFAEDRTTATTDDNFATRDPKPFVMPDDSTLVLGSLVIHPHVSHAGPMAESDIWTTAPVWRAIYDRYVPDPKVVARLHDETRPTNVTIYFATWCGDSKRGVPRLLKALDAAANPKLTVQLVGIGNDFLAPMKEIRSARLTNVPTVLVTRGRSELGRVVETPAGASLEADVVAILDGNLAPHPGRYERKRMIVSGTYEIRDAKGAATEHFELWTTPDDGLLVRSTIERVGENIEIFAALDKRHQPDFVEVTRRTPQHVVRTRCENDHGKWEIEARGDEFGIAQQHTTMPDIIVTPATATLGWPLFNLSEGSRTAYVIGDGVLGDLVSVTSKGVMLRAPRHRIVLGSKSYDVRPTSALNLPQFVRFADGSQRRLTGYTGVLPQAIPATEGN